MFYYFPMLTSDAIGVNQTTRTKISVVFSGYLYIAKCFLATLILTRIAAHIHYSKF